MSIDYQRAANAVFMHRFLDITEIRFEDDVKEIKEHVKEKFDVDLSYTEAFTFWAWRSDMRTDYVEGAVHTPDVDWHPVVDAANTANWFKEFTREYLWQGKVDHPNVSRPLKLEKHEGGGIELVRKK